jgi:hypothetical protein
LAGLAAVGAFSVVAAAASSLGGPLPGPLPLFPTSNWWNLDISTALVDPGSAGYIAFINNGSVRTMHPDFGGDVSPGSAQTYGFPYIVVDNAVAKSAVTFQYADASDGVDHSTGISYPFYGLIVADNGSDLYVSGTYDTRWNNDVLNPAFPVADGQRLRRHPAGLCHVAACRADRPAYPRADKLRPGTQSPPRSSSSASSSARD